jgi:glutamate N-acetyltransferase / amino-acid N-acetyltransferase
MSDSLPPLSSSLPLGFRWGAVCAGIKPSGRADLAAILTTEGCTAAALFTSNRVQAAPITVGREHLRRSGGTLRAVVVNSGNANCATGAAGVAAAQAVCAAVAERFALPAEQVLPSSTGIIGVPLPTEKIVAALEALEGSLGSEPEHFHSFAQAILTTDTRAKVAYSTVEIDGKAVRIAAAAKGAGMIHPQLVPHATMLVYVLTDAAVAPATLSTMLTEAGELSFNRISIDGDTSTNDTVLLLASGASGATVDTAEGPFADALREVCTSLALQIVADGEGVQHVVTLEVSGAPSDADALRIVKAIAHSPLVKTAWAGNDPNWGRLVAAIGYSGVDIDPARITIHYDELPICTDGGRAPDFDAQAVHALLASGKFSVRIQLGLGTGACRFWTTDLTTEYVHVNAAYST